MSVSLTETEGLEHPQLPLETDLGIGSRPLCTDLLDRTPIDFLFQQECQGFGGSPRTAIIQTTVEGARDIPAYFVPCVGTKVTPQKNICDKELKAQKKEKEDLLQPEQFFKVLTIPTKINKGTVEIITPVEMIKKGDKVGSSEADLLAKLGIRASSYGLVVLIVYDIDSILSWSRLQKTSKADKKIAYDQKLCQRTSDTPKA